MPQLGHRWNREKARAMYAAGETLTTIGTACGLNSWSVGQVAKSEKWPRGRKPKAARVRKRDIAR